MKLELKHLAPYLPFELQIEHPTMLVGKREISELRNLGQTNIEVSHRLYVQISNCKPILRPISDLTIKQTIEFYYLSSLDLEIIDINQWHLELIEELKTNQKFQLSQFNKLFKWHFDVFDLISKDLAVSIHDVGQVIA